MKPPIDGFKCKSYPEGHVTQWFAENPHLYRRWGLAYHSGIDIVSPHGTPIFAVEGGVVVRTKRDPGGFGKHVVIMADNLLWTYAHLHKIHVVEGKVLEEGDQIGLMGNTGFVVSGQTPFWKGGNPYAGTHLHIGCRRFKLDDKGWRYSEHMPFITILGYDNGVKGAIDPRPYLDKQPGTGDPTIIEKQKTVISLAQQVIFLLQQLLQKRR